MNDFTQTIYKFLIEKLKTKEYSFVCYSKFLKTLKIQKLIILRHDVDDKKENSLAFARIQHQKGINGTYYFRFVPQSYDEGVIREVYDLGHEVGYHYETMDTCKGDVDKAYDEFCRNLDTLRKIVPVSTICMHGSPRSKWDNKEIWKKYNYKSLGLIGEPYYDTDFSKVAYLTDTGRCWNGSAVSVRDKVESPYHFNFKSTHDIIENIHQLPDQIMFTFHPQRWTNKPLAWTQELLMQNIKNQVKKIVLKQRNNP